ncbi:preprotein translocase subunit SecA [Miniphocaeibacter halophilus]|uniref:Preprotein translocase subunit SecA n=1 Tax=Miniphocaeibacter halophilus TaxID=2931922 RepID=A0AC61MRY2_9FIRM|nr:preprotein translocase subunit SecA [Miniphocaeibacter halophilus]QQK08286.1 preprotein translocase subunit SecA [Miniphocaeibacter halophilus]
MGFFDKLFGGNNKEIKKVDPIVDKIEALDTEMSNLSDEELKNKTQEFKDRLENGETLDDLLPEAYAVVREASWRVLGMKQYRVQLIGGVILHQGRIAEMKTGEGKTLVATLPAYLNALTGEGVHIVTVNDYLAKRDMEWMGKVHQFLGLSVGCITYELDNEQRKVNYACDITYGTNNQFGFDYLRDNMVIYKEDQVQRGLNYAIVDEVDSILVDEARTPLIISGKGDESTDLYVRADRFVRTLQGRIIDPNEEKPDIFDREIKEETVDFIVDEKKKTASLTEKGTAKAEKYFGLENLSDLSNMEIAHHINQALKAHNTMHLDIDYVLKDGEILIVDEFTGRIMQGRRYSDGLHQAIEAKEGVTVQSESKTLATITFQNYFRMYKKIAGMTGTAKTEEDEFSEIYNMDVVEIPTNKPIARKDFEDRIYINEKAKYDAIVREIKEIHETGQPILVGTVTIEVSELISKMLKKERIPHDVLNAKHHEREAEIVAQAGTYGKVTIATNMAGRGTDIVLGGNPEFMAKHDMKKQGYADYIIDSLDSFIETDDEEIMAARSVYNKLHEKYKIQTDENEEKVLAAGGLYILGTERHESRRIDNQLRGRSGRQGDPGSSRFFISLEDDLMRLFGGETIQRFAEKGDFPEDEPIEFKTISKAIERAQKKVEINNFGIRKHVLQYDDVMNVQRKIIYGERERVLQGEDMKDYILEMMKDIISSAVDNFTNGSNSPQEWDMEGLMLYLKSAFLPDGLLQFTDLSKFNEETLKEYITEQALKAYDEKEKEIGTEKFREIERVILLMVVDRKWMDHIDAMDQLRQGIGLRSYGQQDPVRAYNEEGFAMFEEMNDSIKEDTLKGLFNVRPVEEVRRKQVAKETKSSDQQVTVVKGKKIGRNDPCPCGSGKKYKKCCGRNA